MSRREPKTPEEWQEVVDAAAALRDIADLKMYGLLTGGPKINVGRCDRLLERGRMRGITPSRDVTELAVAMIKAINEEGERDGKRIQIV